MTLRTDTLALPADISEADFLTAVITAARLYGWHVNHQRPAMARTGRYVTATTGHVGFPDIALARAGVVIVAELKTNRGRLGPGQGDWLDALGNYGRLWRPSDWADILQELAA